MPHCKYGDHGHLELNDEFVNHLKITTTITIVNQPVYIITIQSL